VALSPKTARTLNSIQYIVNWLQIYSHW